MAEKYNVLLEKLKSFLPVSKQQITEIPNILKNTLDILLPLKENYIGLSQDDTTLVALEALKILKVICSRGSEFQYQLHQNSNLLDLIRNVLCFPPSSIEKGKDNLQKLQISYVQLLFNISVGDLTGDIWKEFKDIFIEGLNPVRNDSSYSNVCALMTYNAIKDQNVSKELNESNELKLILEYCIVHTQNGIEIEDNIQLLLNYFISSNAYTSKLYTQLSNIDRLHLLYYVVEGMKDLEINQEFCDYLVLEFKRLSDNVLIPDGSDVESIKPKEVYCLLEIIALASHCGNEMEETVKADASLFLNLGCLLTAVHKLGKTPETIFTPIQKLGQVAPNSKEDASIETQISYRLKSLLMQSIGNLLYKNKKNQEMVREMDILLAILECTSIDARNPLLKEYSILAVRNACEDNLENQQIIASLTKVKDVPSEIVREFNENVIRIQK